MPGEALIGKKAFQSKISRAAFEETQVEEDVRE